MHGVQRREEETLRILRRVGIDLRQARILDIGCGRGYRLADWLRWGSTPDLLTGVDLRQVYIEQARSLLPGATLRVATAEDLPFETGAFDIVVQSMMMSSILDVGSRRRTGTEMMRVLKPGGLLIWYDLKLRNPRNSHVSPIGRRELMHLFSGHAMEVSAMSLAAPIARLLAPLSFTLCRILERIAPPLRSHLIAAIHKRA